MRSRSPVRAFRGAVAAVLVAAGAAVGAATAAPSPGTALDVPVAHGGLLRSYRLFVPDTLPRDRAVPLVLVLHGLHGEPRSFAGMSKMDEVATRHRFLVAYPAGVSRSWNAGTCCGAARTAGIDDVGFLARVVADVSLAFRVDRSRVYAGGFSNGGMMALRAGCERPDVFAAVASVMGTLLSRCAPARPVSVLQVSGGRDALVPYRGLRWSRALGTPLTAVPVAAGTWERADGCSGLPARTRTARAEVRTYARCAGGATVRTVVLPGSGHAWPGAEHDGWHAPDELWRFFAEHPAARPVARPAAPVLSTRVVAARSGSSVTGYLDGRYDVVLGRRIAVDARRGSGASARWVPYGSVVTDVEGEFRFVAPPGGVAVRLRFGGAPGVPSSAVVPRVA